MKSNCNDGTKDCWEVSQPYFSSDDLNPKLAVSPWAGHRNFAYDLIRFVKPKKVVELGTHYGASFFAFLQASKDFDLKTKHVAVDTWVGDQHAGFYGEEVFQIVNQTLHTYFKTQHVKLLRKTFDDALPDFLDSSIDLLHIDGFHSYDSVKHDYTNWLPKLAKNGIILFHDVAPSSGYGSAVFWGEIKKEIPHFEFLNHSFGLGVLFPNGLDLYAEIARYLDQNILDLYRYKAEFFLRDKQYRDAQLQLEERWEVMQSMDAMIRERDKVIIDQRRLLKKASR